MLNRLFFERVIIRDKFMSTFTGITSECHFNQIEFLFQASSSKNILTNLGENRKPYYFPWSALPPLNHLAENLQNSRKKTFKTYNGKFWPIVMLKWVIWEPSAKIKKHLKRCFIRYSMSLKNRISIKTQDFLTQTKQSTSFVPASPAWPTDETMFLFCFRH